MTSSADRLRDQEKHFNRRELLLGAGTVGLAAIANRRCYAQAAQPSADRTIRIAPISLEIGPNKVIQTTGYNNTVPGPPLRLKEGMPVTINVINDSGYPNLIHWHGCLSRPFRTAPWKRGRRSSRPENRCSTASRPNPRAHDGITATPWR